MPIDSATGGIEPGVYPIGDVIAYYRRLAAEERAAGGPPPGPPTRLYKLPEAPRD